nr:hypothetical protein [Anaerolineae bacterium]
MSESLSYFRKRSRIGAFVRRNPVALKELRGRMRGSRAFAVLTVYVTLMGLFTASLYLIYSASTTLTLTTSGGIIGKLIFGGVVAIELFLVCFVSPAFTAGAISGEQERRTLSLLRTTLLPARRIVIGKLLSALAYNVLLLIVAVPLQSLAFLMGGVTIEEVVLSIEILLVTAIAYGAIGIFFSAVTRRTLTASILTYTAILLTTVVMPIVSFILFLLSPLGGNFAYGRTVFESILLAVFWLSTALNPVAAAVSTEVVLLSKGTVILFTHRLAYGLNIPLISSWIPYTIFYLMLTVILIALTIRIIRRYGAD